MAQNLSGASALLFERLVDDDPRTAREPQPFRTLTIPEVRASVRRNGTPAEHPLRRQRRGARGPRAHRARLWHPRLQLPSRRSAPRTGSTWPPRSPRRSRPSPACGKVRVTVEPPTTTQRRLLAHIEAVLVLEAVTEPVAFRWR